MMNAGRSSGVALCYKTEAVLTVTFKPDLKATQMAQSVRSGAADSSMARALHEFTHTLAELEDLLSSVLRMERLGEVEDEARHSFFFLVVPPAALPDRRRVSDPRSGDADVPGCPSRGRGCNRRPATP